MTTCCIALVVAVFVMVMALANGLKATYISSGDPRNLLVLRKGSMAESSSQITFDNVRQTKFLDGIARDERGDLLASAEIMVVITLPRASGGKAHVLVRGLSAPDYVATTRFMVRPNEPGSHFVPTNSVEIK